MTGRQRGPIICAPEYSANLSSKCVLNVRVRKTIPYQGRWTTVMFARPEEKSFQPVSYQHCTKRILILISKLNRYPVTRQSTRSSAIHPNNRDLDYDYLGFLFKLNNRSGFQHHSITVRPHLASKSTAT